MKRNPIFIALIIAILALILIVGIVYFFQWMEGKNFRELKSVKEISSGEMDHTCAVLKDGKVKCWGNNSHLQLGTDTPHVTLVKSTPYLVSVPEVNNAVQVDTGLFHTCALLKDKTIKCWGQNHYKQLGNKTGGFIDIDSKPVSVLEIDNAVQVSTGSFSSCALLENGRVKCWGYGYGFTPVLIPEVEDVVQVDVESGIKPPKPDWACAVLKNGAVKCWHGGEEDIMGEVIKPIDFSITEIPEAKDVAQVELGFPSPFNWVLLKDGTIKYWEPKDGLAGKLVSFPFDINNATQISVGFNHVCALLESGEIKCWGSNSIGQLGTGDNKAVKGIALVLGINNAIQISAGDKYTCAVLMDERAKCWGNGSIGQLGGGKASTSFTPIFVKEKIE